MFALSKHPFLATRKQKFGESLFKCSDKKSFISESSDLASKVQTTEQTEQTYNPLFDEFGRHPTS